MKTIDELKQGDCQVITNYGQFHGYFSKEHKCVFFAIPSHYEILGYIQD